MGRLVSLLWHRLEIEKARVKRGPVQVENESDRASLFDRPSAVVQ